MKHLHNLSIRKKFAVVIIPLIVVIIGFDYLQIKHNYLDYNDHSRLNKAIIVSIEINQVVHELQKERSITSGFLSSEGGDFMIELASQRKKTDSTLARFYAEIENPSLADLLDLHKDDISYLNTYFARILEVRSQVDDRTMSSDQSIAYFTDINTNALNTVNKLINETRDKNVAQQVHAIIYFLKAKERSSIERAIGTQAFSHNKMDFEIYHQFAALVASQNSYLDAFITISNDESSDFYERTLQGPDISEVVRMREVLFANTDLNEDPNHWYKMNTSKINSLKKVEDFMSSNVHAYTDRIASEAFRDFWTFLVLDLIIGILAFSLMTFIVTKLIDNVSKLERFAKRVAKGDLSHRVRIETKDEIGQYARTFNIMVKEINKSHAELKKERDLAKYLYNNIYLQSEVVFQNVNQGIFLLDKKFKISKLYSKQTEIIFDNKKIGGESLANFMRTRVIPRDLEALEMFMRHLFNTDIDEDVLAQLNPVEQIKIFSEIDGIVKTKHIRISFTRVMKRDTIQSIMVTILDETESILLQQHIEEAEEKKKVETEQMLSILKIDPSLLRGFLHNTRKVLKAISEKYEHDKKQDFQELLDYTFQTIHNLKGNSTVIGLTIITDKFHEIEESIVKLKDQKVSGNDFLTILYEINSVDKMTEDMIEMLHKVATVYKKYAGEVKVDSNYILIDTLERGAQLMGEESGKGVAFSFVNNSKIIIPEKYKTPVKDIVIQLMRNSISHGLEAPNERVEIGKSVKGNISVSLEQANNKDLLVTYKDDGTGLQIDKIKTKAVENSLITQEEGDKMKDSEVFELLFRQGFSTAEQVDKLAGHGQGLSLVKSIIEEQKGEYKLNTKEGKFFEMTIQFPAVDKDNLEQVA